MPIDIEGVPGEGAAAEGRAVDACNDFAEALKLRRKSGGMGEDPVRPSHGLGFLEMSVAGHLLHVSAALVVPGFALRSYQHVNLRFCPLH